MKQYVLIGNSAAAAGCIGGIRSIDSEGKRKRSFEMLKKVTTLAAFPIEKRRKKLGGVV